MMDSVTYDPSEFSEVQLVGAARGGDPQLGPRTAVALIRSKLGDLAEPVLSALAADESLDTRTRQAAVSHLREFPAARALLQELSRSGDAMVSVAATEALTASTDE